MAENKLENVWNMLISYEFSADVIDKDIFCLFCRKIMINSFNGPCGCRFCLDCLTNYLKEGEKYCPGKMEKCENELLKINENVFYDNPMNVKISKIIVKCPEDCCEFKDELKNIEEHLKICNYRSANCPYSNIGCYKTKISQSNMIEHLQVDMINHTELLMDCIDHLKNKIDTLVIIIDNLNKENKNLTLDSENKQITIQELQTKFNEQNREIDLLNRDIVALRNTDQYMRNDIDDFKLELRRNQNEQIEQFNNKYQEIENKFVNVKEEKIKGEEDLIKFNKINDNILENGEFVWKIDKISEKMKDAKDGINTTIYSDSFYTHKYGYKMCLRLDPYGEGNAKGTHLSVFFCLMKGEYDDNLLWPFKFDVTLSWINQQTRPFLLSYTIEYIHNLNLDNWAKPKNEKNLGLGKKDFIGLEDLSSHKDLIVNNQLFIKCAININKVNKLLQVEMNVNKLNCEEFIWKIDQINEKMKNAKHEINTIIYSDSFYTHKYGYKMCLCVYPDGCSSGKGTHLSVFYFLMKGEYDDILEWPFKFDVTFSLINQQTRLAHVSKIVKFNPTNVNYFKKPINERNDGFGYPQFMKLDELLTNKSLIINNQIFIKCSENIVK